MNFKWHFITSLIFFVTLMLLFKAITVSLIIIPIIIGWISDVDLRFGSHRNIVLHSLFVPLIVLIFNPSLLTILILLSFGLHCICDISILSKKGGFFTIKYFGLKSIGGFYFAQGWLICNFIASITIFTVYMVYV